MAEQDAEIIDGLRAEVAQAPTKPGVYRWLNEDNDILYIGKAKNLRNRLRSYVQEGVKHGPWKTMMMRSVRAVEYTITNSELEALILETNLIKEHKPKYNVLMKDDKNYVYVEITTQEAYPRINVVRQMADADATYFGPYVSARDTRRTLEMLHTIFPYKACRQSLDTLNKYAERGEDTDKPLRTTPCLEAQIHKCCGLCIGTISHAEYRERIDAIIRFLQRERTHVIEALTQQMQQAAGEKKFEKAAKLRDTLQYVQSLEEKQIVSDTSHANADVIGIAEHAGKTHVVILRERNGKLIEELGYPLKGEAETIAEALEEFLPQYYLDTPDIPDTVLCRASFDGINTLQEWLSLKRGKKVSIHTPERGKKSQLLDMAEKNAEEKLKQQFTKWELAEQKVETALTELKEALLLTRTPKRIECYDISHTSGTETVGSMVTFVNGKPKNDHYRSFTLRTIKKGEIDDYKALQEVLRRRLAHLKRAKEVEDQQLADKGIAIRKARKKDLSSIEELLNDHNLDAEELDQKSFLVAEIQSDEGAQLIGCCRLKQYDTKLTELTSVWIDERWQGMKLGHILVKRLLRSVKKGKVYLCCERPLLPYYTALGFEEIRVVPKVLQEKMQRVCHTCAPEDIIVMTFDTRKNKPDASLESIPDLLVLDGGKGQLSSGVEVLNAMQLQIPIASIAKREEEIFIPDHPVARIHRDSEARFLIMRMRDEAHRFANRHREKRAKRSMLS